MFLEINTLYFADGREIESPIRSDFTLKNGARFAVNSANVVSVQEVEIGGTRLSLLKTTAKSEFLVAENFDSLQHKLELIEFVLQEDFVRGFKKEKIALNPQKIVLVGKSRVRNVTQIVMYDDADFFVKEQYSEVIKKLNA